MLRIEKQMKDVFTYSGLIAILVIIISSIDRFSEIVISVSICEFVNISTKLTGKSSYWWCLMIQKVQTRRRNTF